MSSLQMFKIMTLFLAIWMLALVHPRGAGAQAPVTYLAYDVTLDVQANGAIDVAMVQHIQFEGEFTTAFFEIPRAYVSRIDNINVSGLSPDGPGAISADEPRTPVDFSVDERADTVWVEWTYTATTPGDVRAFLLEYTAWGAIWVYPDGDFITWDAVNADRSGVGVESSTVRINLPPTIDMDTVVYNASGPEYSSRVDGQSLVFTAHEPIDDAVAFNVAATFPHGILDTTPQPWQRLLDAETVSVALDSVDVDLTLNADGSLDVVERYALEVIDGYLDTGFRELRLLYLDAVRDFTMARDGVSLDSASEPCTDCVVVTDSPRQPDWVSYSDWQQEVVIDDTRAGAFTADWQHDQLGAGTQTRFDLRYTVDGALRVDADSQFLTWDALPDYGVPVANAQITLRLPPGVSTDQVTVAGGDAERVDPETLTLHYAPGGDPRPRWQIGVTLPAGATDAVKPAWQTDVERALVAQQDAEQAAAQRQIARRTGGVLAIVLGLAGLVVGWFRWGRRRVKEQVGGYLSEPPSELDAGIVAYLVDDNAATKSLMASLFQLASMGALDVELDPAFRLRRVRAEALSPGTTVTTRSGASVRVSKHIATLFNAVILPTVPADAFVPLDRLAAGLHQHAADLFAALADDTEVYLIDSTSGRSGRSLLPMIGFAAWFVLIVSVALRVLAGGRMEIGFLGPLFLVFFAVVMILNFVGKQKRTRHTHRGEEEAVRWRKFRTYLLDIEQYGDHSAARAIMERYFHYAIALGVADDVLKQAVALDTPVPTWMPVPASLPIPDDPTEQPSAGTSTWTPRPPTTGGTAISGSGVPETAVSRPRPTLSNLSSTLGTSLAAASAAMGNSLSAATGRAPTKVTVGRGQEQRTLEWDAGTPMDTVVDSLMRDSFTHAAKMQAARAAAARSSGQSGTWRGSGSRSGGGFGRSSSRRSSGGRSGGRRSGGGGRSGFR